MAIILTVYFDYVLREYWNKKMRNYYIFEVTGRYCIKYKVEST